MIRMRHAMFVFLFCLCWFFFSQNIAMQLNLFVCKVCTVAHDDSMPRVHQATKSCRSLDKMYIKKKNRVVIHADIPPECRLSSRMPTIIPTLPLNSLRCAHIRALEIMLNGEQWAICPAIGSKDITRTTALTVYCLPLKQ